MPHAKDDRQRESVRFSGLAGGSCVARGLGKGEVSSLVGWRVGVVSQRADELCRTRSWGEGKCQLAAKVEEAWEKDRGSMSWEGTFEGSDGKESCGKREWRR